MSSSASSEAPDGGRWSAGPSELRPAAFFATRVLREEGPAVLRHDEDELVAVVRGGAHVRLGGRNVFVGAQTLFFTPRGGERKWVFSAPSVIIALSRKGASRSIAREPAVFAHPLVVELFRELERFAGSFPIAEAGEVLQALGHCAFAVVNARSQAAFERPLERPLPPETTQRIARFVEEHLDRPLTVPDLAAMAHLSPSQFTRSFKAACGLPPYRFILERRLERAKQLLSTTDMPVAEVALDSGFSCQSHLTNVFKRMMGTSPAKFRSVSARRTPLTGDGPSSPPC